MKPLLSIFSILGKADSASEASVACTFVLPEIKTEPLDDMTDFVCGIVEDDAPTASDEDQAEDEANDCRFAEGVC